MIETRVRKVGNSAVMTLTSEMLAIMDVKPGDTLFVVRGDDGSLKILPQGGAFLRSPQIL
jgi:Growth regulator